jgi:DNA-binding transcriptional MocR family regulator
LERRDALMSALERHLSGSMTFQPPAGGMSLWAQVDESIDLPGWIARGLESGVAFGRSRRFAFEGAEPHALRLGFAALTPDELEAAVRRMAVALTRRRKGTATR